MTAGVTIFLAALCLCFSLMPLIPAAHGSVRIFDFCRLQVAALAAFLVLVSLWMSWHSAKFEFAVFVPSITALVIQIFYVLPFTPIWKQQTALYSGDKASVEEVSVLSCNVKQSNRSFENIASHIEARKPDIAIFMEVDDCWIESLRPCLRDYSNVIECPQDNSYGMLLAARLKVRHSKIQYLLNENVPSIDAELFLASGRVLRVMAIHPEPPVPTRDTEGRDAEILLVGHLAREETKPIIVTGDLNDVAWSRTTRRFLRISRLLDPRQGRGFYNSFDAQRWYLRWPLDHIFHSRHFELMKIERLPYVGSDHFPMLYSLALVKSEDNRQPTAASEEDLKEADRVISAERGRDRPPVGEDWE